jgi:RNA polymerase sigma factor (sigma-70 family)
MPGDRAEFESLYRRHAPLVHRRACALLGSESDAREIVQELFASLWERPQQYAARSSFTTFLYAATTHACLNRLRNRRTQLQLLARHTLEAPGTMHEASAERALQLREFLRRLPLKLAQVAVYHHLDEMTYEEIAETMGCSRRHVADLIQRLAQHSDATEQSA